MKRCEVTKNPVGTDTWSAGRACPCAACQRYIAAGGKPINKHFPAQTTPSGEKPQSSLESELAKTREHTAKMLQAPKAAVYGCPNCKSVKGFTEHNIVHTEQPFQSFQENEAVPGDAYANDDTYGAAEVCWESAELVEDDPARYKCDNCDHAFYAPVEIEQVPSV